MFRDRFSAGSSLGKLVQQINVENSGLSSLNSVVVAMPRDGVPVGFQIAKALYCPLDIVVAKKLSPPDSLELELGAVSSLGVSVIDQEASYKFDLPPEYFASQCRRLQSAAKTLEAHWRYQAGLLQQDLDGKTCIVVDDIVTSIFSVIAALRTVRLLGAREVIFAAPVIASSTADILQQECEFIFAAEMPEHTTPLIQYYEDFRPVEDTDVVQALKRSAMPAANISQTAVQQFFAL